MASSERIRKQPTKICLGDLDTQVNIYKRNLQVPTNTKYKLHLEELRKNVWCMWKVTAKGIEFFDNVNQSIGVATDIITLHYDKEFREFEYVELDNSILYEVISCDWLDPKNKEFINLYCVQKGDKSKKVNIL